MRVTSGLSLAVVLMCGARPALAGESRDANPAEALGLAGPQDMPPAERPGANPREAEQVREWGLAQGWTEVTSPPPSTPRYEPTEADRQRGFFVFVPDRNQIHAVDLIPGADLVPGKLAAMTFPGEFEGLGIGVHALRGLESVAVEVSDLVGPEGGIIRAGEIVVRDVIYAPLSLHTARGRENKFRMQPMWLLTHTPAPLAAGRGRLVWLTVPCPAAAPAGRYTGTVTVRAGDAVETRPIELTMQPFRLDGSLCSWAPVTAGNGFDLDLYRQLVEHHMTGLSWWWGDWGLTITREGDKAGIDTGPLDLLNAVTRQAGMRGPWILLLGNMVRGHLERRIGGYYRDGRRPPLFDVKLVPMPRRMGTAPVSGEPAVADLADTEMDRRYMEVIRALADRAKDLGYPRIIIIPYDEPSRYLAAWNAHWADLIRKEVPEFKVLNTPQGSTAWAKALMPHSDYMDASGADDPIYGLTIAAGKGIVGYNRLTADQSFAQARYNMGLRFAEQQPDLIYFWSLNFGTVDARTPFNDLLAGDSGARHRFAWRPLAPGGRWIETLVWEAQREGAKDYLLVLMLERALASSSSGGAAQVRKDLAAFKREAARSAADLDARRAKLVTWYRTVTGR